MDSEKLLLRIFGRKTTAGTLLSAASCQVLSWDSDVRRPLFVNG